MSTSVYNPTRITLSPRNQNIPMHTQPKVVRVKRTLFGPVDPKSTQDFLNEELKKVMIVQSEKWNFDFQKEKTLRPGGEFEWRPMTPRKKATPVKRKIDCNVDTSEQYFAGLETRIAERPEERPVKCSLPSCNGQKVQQQSRITDFMKSTKRPSSSTEVSKKQSASEWTSEIPTKIPRLDIIS